MRKIGTFIIEFHSEDKVSIVDNIPDPTKKHPEPIAFPFLLAAKYLYNCPPPSGQQSLANAISKLESLTRDKEVGDLDISLGQIFSDTEVDIVNETRDHGVRYENTYFAKGNSYGVESHFPNGNELYYHRSSIDIVFDHFKNRWGLSFLMTVFENDFLGKISQQGVENAPATYQVALETGVALLSIVSSKFF